MQLSVGGSEVFSWQVISLHSLLPVTVMFIFLMTLAGSRAFVVYDYIDFVDWGGLSTTVNAILLSKRSLVISRSSL